MLFSFSLTYSVVQFFMCTHAMQQPAALFRKANIAYYNATTIKLAEHVRVSVERSSPIFRKKKGTKLYFYSFSNAGPY